MEQSTFLLKIEIQRDDGPSATWEEYPLTSGRSISTQIRGCMELWMEDMKSFMATGILQ